MSLGDVLGSHENNSLPFEYAENAVKTWFFPSTKKFNWFFVWACLDIICMITFFPIARDVIKCTEYHPKEY